MKRIIVFTIVLIIIAGFLAPVIFKGFFYLVIEPLSYYWWRLKLVFQIIPQSSYWLFLIITVGLVFWFYFLRDIFIDRPSAVLRVSEKGQVLVLAEQLAKSKKRFYFKWLIANRLSCLTLDVINEKISNPEHKIDDLIAFENKNFPDIRPDIRMYLKGGLRGSFSRNRRKIGYPMLRQTEETPFDVDLDDVITFIESQMEL